MTPEERRSRNGLAWLLYVGGQTQREVGRLLGISGSQVSTIVKLVERRMERRVDGHRCLCGHQMTWHPYRFSAFLGRHASSCRVDGCPCAAYGSPNLYVGVRIKTAEERATFLREHRG